MPDERYFLPDHAKLNGVYSKDELRALLQAGKLSRSEMVLDDETGLAHLLGDLLTMPHRAVRTEPTRSTTGAHDEPPQTHEFRADTPLPLGASEDDRDQIEADDWDQPEETFPDDDEETQLPAEEEAAARPEEELLYQGHPSWLAYPRSLLALFACGAGAWLCYRYHAGLAWIIVLGSLGLLPVLFVLLDRATTTYFITTRRVEMEFGIVGRNTKEVRISDIRAIDVVQDGWNAVVGIGHVMFDSAAGPNAEVKFHNVRRPHDLKQRVREQQG